MPRTTRPELDRTELDQLLAAGEEAPSVAEKTILLQMLRASSPHRGAQLDEFLLDQLTRSRAGVADAETALQQLRDLVDRLTAPPWHPALFLGAVDTAPGPRAMVQHGGARRLVGVAEDVDLPSLAVGKEVFLSHGLNVILGSSPATAPRGGEMATFERMTADDRCVLRWRDEEAVVDLAGALDPTTLTRGDTVRWDRNAWLALERMEPATAQRFLLTEVPTLGREHVGGQDAALERLLTVLTAALIDPDKAARYALNNRKSVLLVGPPGVGKTLMARVAVSQMNALGRGACHFAVVKPAEFESCWVGETERTVRSVFGQLNKISASGSPVVLFLDEIESIGRIRGSFAAQHADRFLGALLAEIDGFSARSGIAIIAATNRRDLLDPALLERLSDQEITVARPDMNGARAIFDIHLPASLPFETHGSSEMRSTIIDTAVTRLYSPNADNELCILGFRDGKTRTVVARELMSGRVIEQVCRAMRQAALARDIRGGESGVSMADMHNAVSDVIDRLRAILTPRNAFAYLSDLPHDVDVVSVDPLARRVPRPHHYLNAA